MKHQITHKNGSALFEVEVPFGTPEDRKTCNALEQAARRGVDLSGADLRGANLKGLDAPRIILNNADLHCAVLAGANLHHAMLNGANLQRADLSSANVIDADCRKIILTEAWLESTDFSSSELTDADLSHAWANRASFLCASMARVDLTSAALAYACFAGTCFDNAFFETTRVGRVTLVGTQPIIQIGPIGSRDDSLIALMTSGGLLFCIGCKKYVTRWELQELIKEQHGYNHHARSYHAAIEFAETYFRVLRKGIDCETPIEKHIQHHPV